MAQLFLKRNSDFKSRNNHNQAHLQLAAQNCSTEVAQLLLKHNPDIKARDIVVSGLEAATLLKQKFFMSVFLGIFKKFSQELFRKVYLLEIVTW